MAGLAGSEEMQCSAKRDDAVSGLQTSLACAHLWIAETDLQLLECICNKGTSVYFSLKEIKC